MAAPPPPPLRLADSLPDELIEEILLRLPPNEPSSLLRTSLVCKPWRSIISHRRFRRRLHELHGRPPVLGFLRNNVIWSIEDFVATTASAFPLALPDIVEWRALDCRHGRVLLLVFDMAPDWGELLVWDPITGDEERVSAPDAMWDTSFQGDNPTATIVCAAHGCDHCGCHGMMPFYLVMVCTVQEEEDLDWVTWACSYSSETGEWGDVTEIEDFVMGFMMHPTSVLVGDSLLYFLSDQGIIIEYDLDGDDATIISPHLEFYGNDSVALILAEDGRLGVAESFSDSHLNIWSRLVSDGNDAALWVKSRVIYLHNLLPALALEEEKVKPMSFAERANVLFIRTPGGIFTIELQSEQVRKVCEDENLFSLVPIESFYTPQASQGGEGEYSSAGEEGEYPSAGEEA